MGNKYRPNTLACGGCPEWDDVNGCWNQPPKLDIRNCLFMNEHSLVFDSGIYDGIDYEIIDSEEPVLPITLQMCKDELERHVDNALCKADPDYDLEAHLKKLGLPSKEIPAEEILVITCPYCTAASFYNGGFTDTCSCCGYYNLADHSEEAYTLADYLDPDDPPF